MADKEIMNVETQVKTWEGLKAVAESMLKTGFLPPTLKTPEQVIMVIMTGRELNIPMMEALRGINVISQKPAVAPQLMLGMINRSGELEDMTIEIGVNEVKVTMKRRDKTAYTATFGEKEAKLMNLLWKDNYKKQAMNMYKWRAISACARVVFPDVIGGLYLPEEIESHTDTEEAMGTIEKTAEIAAPENYDKWVEDFFDQLESDMEAMKEPFDVKKWENGHKQEMGMLLDKDRDKLQQMLTDKHSQLITGNKKKEEPKRKKLNLREYMDLAKECKGAVSLREWFKGVQANAAEDLSTDDFNSLIADLKRIVSQMPQPEKAKQQKQAAEMADYLRESPDIKEFNHRLTEISPDRTKLPKELRTWLNNELESIKKELEAK